ncbi:MAG: hypothetical protein ACLGIB_09605 [Actinomycetota bacterium]
MTLRVAIVCPQPELRMSAVKAFDRAPLDWDLRLVSEPHPEADVVVSVGADRAGAITMDPAHPERVIDEIVRSSSRPDVIVVVGASGGCGTTSVAVHLAAALARRARANLVDLHSDRGAAMRLGLALDELPLADGPLLVPVAGGFRFALGPEGTSDACLETARVAADKVVVDTPRSSLDAIESPSRVLLVMTPTLPSVRKAAGVLLERPELSWVPITNRTGPGSETTRVDVERILGRKLAIELPCSPGLRDAEDDLRLLTSPLSPWRLAVQRLAAAL